jgi:2-keto-4-pentenoate hydratase/2-oxohepta-3-ene-1,7-dioic acid hydratase in catechol pathway
MKIVVINNISGDKEPYISLRPDNAVLRNNDDFYMPHFTNDMVCGSGIVVRISRLAKCIAPKFASRCYDSITTGVTFVARDTMQQALSEGRACDEAYSFDRSTAIGTEWIEPSEIGEGVVEMKVGEKSQKFSVAELKQSIDECVSAVSQKLTLKMGDLVFIAAPTEVCVECGEQIVVTLNNIEPLNFCIK